MKRFLAACLIGLLTWGPVQAQPSAGRLTYKDLDQTIQKVVEQYPLPTDRVILERAALRGIVGFLDAQNHDASALFSLNLTEPQVVQGLPQEIERRLAPLSPEQRSHAYRAAIRECLQSREDPGTLLYEPGTYQKSLEELGYTLGGVGFFVNEDPDAQGRFSIVQMIEGFPAEKLGIRPGDHLVGVKGQRTTTMTFSQLAGLVRGPVGTSVDILVQHGEDEPKSYTITREWLNPNPKGAQSRIAETGLGYVRLKYLGLRSDVDIRTMLEALKEQGARRLVLDLRNCPGEIAGAQGVLSLFLPAGETAYASTTRKGVDVVKASSDKPPFDMPMVVLINEYSGDAASIVAGSLRDHFRAVLIGQATNPKEMKAYKWTATELADGSVVSVTDAFFSLPRGKMLNRDGLRPDIVVPTRDPIASATGTQEDRAYMRAIRYLREEPLIK